MEQEPTEPSGELGQRLLSESEWAQIGRRLRLSDRELQVTRLIFDDAKDTTIADTLAISPHTVHTHQDRLHRKLNVCSRVGVLLRVFAEYKNLVAPRASP